MSRQTHPIVAQLAAERVRQGLTQPKLAERIRYSTDSIKGWETGHKAPSFDSMTLWAGALGYRIALIPVGASITDDELTARLRYLDAERQRPAAKEHPATPLLSATTTELFQELIGALAQLFDDAEAAPEQEAA